VISPLLLEGKARRWRRRQIGEAVRPQMLLKLAASTGGAGLVAGRTGIADAMRSFSSAETGRLQVLDWAATQ